MKFSDVLGALNLDTFIAFDFETTGLNPSVDQITEFAGVRFRSGEIDETFSTLVNPGFPIPEKIIRITGITDEMVADSPSPSEVTPQIAEFMGNDPIVAHNIPFDLSFLESLYKSHLGEDREVENALYDTLPLARSFLFFLPNHQLGTVAEYFGYSRSGEHRAEADTINVGGIFLKLVEEVCSYPLPVIQKIVSSLKRVEVANKQFYVAVANLLVAENHLDEGLLPSKVEKEMPSNIFKFKGSQKELPKEAEMVFGEGGLLQKAISDGSDGEFEVRADQISYADKSWEIMGTKGIGVIEAGTGLGKSLAYLFPSITYALTNNDGPTVIASFTKNLQDQLFYREVPRIAKTLDVSFSATMMKGRNNYICKTRLDWLIADNSGRISPREAESLGPVIVWLHWTNTGDLTECAGFKNNKGSGRVSSLIRSDQGFCNRKVCRNYNGCFITPLREASQEADLIVVNHSLLLSDLTMPGILPSFPRVVIDEGHNLVNAAYNQFEVRFTRERVRDNVSMVDPKSARSLRLKNQIQTLGQVNSDLINLFKILQSSAKEIRKETNIVFDSLTEEIDGMLDRSVSYAQKIRYFQFTELLSDVGKNLKNLLSSVDEMITNVIEIQKLLVEVKGSDEAILNFERLGENLKEIKLSCRTTVMEPNEDWVYWVEGRYFNEDFYLALVAVPIDPGVQLQKFLFEAVDSILITSATLRVGDGFDYFLQRIGLHLDSDNTVNTSVFPSPFFYDDQCIYYQWVGEELPNSIEFPKVVSDLLEYLQENFQKRTMILFTSRKSLIACYEELRSRGNIDTSRVFAQHQSSSRSSLLRGFRDKPDGILMGTTAFWEGVDLPRSLLEILIIAKLPFEVHTDPLVASFNERISEAGRNPFMERTVPEAAIRFRQGFGRLIRTSHDEGLFINLDNRVAKKQYGSYFQKLIPVTMRPFSNVNEIKFL